MNIIDSVLILFLLFGAVLGFKRGVIKSVISFVGIIIVVLLSLYLKDILASFLYTNFAFFNTGIKAINIIIYQVIAFLIVFIILYSILKLIIKVSGLIELLLKFTVILSIPSKILGAIFGFFEFYIFAFIILFTISTFNIQSSIIEGSKLNDKILNNTPVLTNSLGNSYNAMKELTNLKNNDENSNEKAIEIIKNYNIIDEKNINKLLEKGRID